MVSQHQVYHAAIALNAVLLVLKLQIGVVDSCGNFRHLSLEGVPVSVVVGKVCQGCLRESGAQGGKAFRVCLLYTSRCV